MSEDHLFQHNAKSTLKRCIATFTERADQYGDSWRDCQYNILKSVCVTLGIEIPDEALNAVAAAALCDVKYSRFVGGYKDDSLVDMIAYESFLAEEMKKVLTKEG